MTRLLLDGAERGPAPGTWGQALDAIDRELAGGGRIVTDVRFDGLDEPAFREPRVLDQALDDVATIEVISGSPESLIARCLAEAAASIEPLSQVALEIGEGFRGLDIEGASAGLAELAEGMSSLIAIAGATTMAARGTSVARSGQDHPIGPLAGELTGFVDALIEAQQSQDWISVADILQYDVAPALRRWAPVFDAVTGPGAGEPQAAPV